MIRLSRLVLLLAVPALLTGCGATRHPIDPPNASIQQLEVLPDGHWKLQIRLENFSDKTIHYATLKASLRVAGVAAADLALKPDMDVPGQSADTVDTTLMASAEMQKAFNIEAQEPGGAEYELKGTINIPAADKDFKFEHKSRLSPVPGLPNQYH